jgi:potassium channel subfamily K, other eukaryote
MTVLIRCGAPVIVWAIFGVATMTLLIAVLSEAYESTYKKAVHQKGIRRTLTTIRENAQRRGSGTLSRTATMSSVASSGGQVPMFIQDTEEGTAGQGTLTEEPADIASALPDKALPYLLLEAAKSFHEHVNHFSHNDTSDPTPELRQLLDSMADENNMTKQEKDELMKDAEARRVMFMMSYEGTWVIVQVFDGLLLIMAL